MLMHSGCLVLILPDFLTTDLPDFGMHTVYKCVRSHPNDAHVGSCMFLIWNNLIRNAGMPLQFSTFHCIWCTSYSRFIECRSFSACWVGVMSINSDVLSSGVFGQLSTADPIGMTLCHPPVSYSMPLFVRI